MRNFYWRLGLRVSGLQTIRNIKFPCLVCLTFGTERVWWGGIMKENLYGCWEKQHLQISSNKQQKENKKDKNNKINNKEKNKIKTLKKKIL